MRSILETEVGKFFDECVRMYNFGFNKEYCVRHARAKYHNYKQIEKEEAIGKFLKYLNAIDI